MAELILDGGPILLLDSKGRVTIPTRSREALKTMCEDQLTITKSRSRCLTIFPRPLWETFSAKILAWPMDNDDWRRIFIASASHVDIDSASRVLVAPELREWAGIERDVYPVRHGPALRALGQGALRRARGRGDGSRAAEELRNMVL